MPLNIISYKKAIWKGIEGHLKGIVQKLEDSRKLKHVWTWSYIMLRATPLPADKVIA